MTHPKPDPGKAILYLGTARFALAYALAHTDPKSLAAREIEEAIDHTNLALDDTRTGGTAEDVDEDDQPLVDAEFFDQILAVLRDGVTDPAEIGSRLGSPPELVGYALSVLEVEGTAEEDGPGCWRPVATTAAVPPPDLTPVQAKALVRLLDRAEKAFPLRGATDGSAAIAAGDVEAWLGDEPPPEVFELADDAGSCRACLHGQPDGPEADFPGVVFCTDPTFSDGMWVADNVPGGLDPKRRNPPTGCPGFTPRRKG